MVRYIRTETFENLNGENLRMEAVYVLTLRGFSVDLLNLIDVLCGMFCRSRKLKFEQSFLEIQREKLQWR